MLRDTKLPQITLGISSCLLGNAVRYDGAHKRNDYIYSTLSHSFNLQPFCPEVAIGLGVPRPPIQLVQQKGQGIRVIEVQNTTKDYTASLTQYAERVVHTDLVDISGFIFKKSSPSCGMERVNVYKTDGVLLHQQGIGHFAKVIQQQYPLLPVEDEDCFADLQRREVFLRRVYAYHAASI